MSNVLQIRPEDNVAIALAPISKGTVLKIGSQEIEVKQDIPNGHKIALRDIAQGEHVIRYAYSIGLASQPIAKGEWVHTHNLHTGLKDKLEYTYNPTPQRPVQPAGPIPTFLGYRRHDGQVGIRNEIWIINMVGCTNRQSQRLAQMATEKYQSLIKDGIIDGFYDFAHPYGCSQLGDDLENTQKILAGFVRHPNAAGVLVIGLGCENNRLDDFKRFIEGYDPNRVKFMVLQEVEDEFATGMELLDQLVQFASAFKQQPIPVSELKIGLKCGGSDGFSGITGNPLVGHVADKLISYGGTAVLTEVPEMFGAETILMNRAKDEEIFQKTVALINDFKDYFIRNGQEVYENPSPGNKDGGITTLEEKSLGCTQKGGTSTVMDVLKYGERIKTNGLNLLEGPGNDIVSTTAMTAAGAHIILFTTGRGNPMGAAVPTIKISTNSGLAKKKANWIDFNAGQLLEGVSMETLTEQFFDYLLKVASKQERTKNEINGYRDIAIFKTGVTL